MSRKTTSFNIDRALNSVERPSVFDRIVKEIDAMEIPAVYINHILVQYHDGNVVELSGKELTHPMPVNRNVRPEEMEGMFKKMKDVRIFLNIGRLETEVNEQVEKLLGNLC